jgi:glycine cleavage system aminomethyltransferase T
MTWSPILKRVISLGLLEPKFAAAGSRVKVEWTVEGTREKVWATVVRLPFLDLPRKRG